MALTALSLTTRRLKLVSRRSRGITTRRMYDSSLQVQHSSWVSTRAASRQGRCHPTLSTLPCCSDGKALCCSCEQTTQPTLTQCQLCSLEVVQQPLCVQQVVHGDHVVLLTHDTRTNTTQLLRAHKQACVSACEATDGMLAPL